MNEKIHHKEHELKSFITYYNMDATEFQFLNKLEADELAKLRNKISDEMEEGQKKIWETIAKVSKYMPNFLNAKVTEDILGAKIGASLSYYLPPKEALGIAAHFSTKFFCDILEHLIPEKIEGMIRESPYDLMKKAVDELVKRKNYFLVGSLIDFTPLSSVDRIARSIQHMPDLIFITYNADDKKRVLKLVENFDDIKIFSILKAGLGKECFSQFQEIYSEAHESLLKKTGQILLTKDKALHEQYELMVEKF
jgi:hypothetical protein